MYETMQKPKKKKTDNPYAGKPLPIDEALSERIRDSFGLDTDELDFRESGDVADMGALAATQGNAVRFAPGAFAPHTPSGLHLLGHELTHVLEQAKGGVRANVPGSQIHFDMGHENYSEEMGDAFAGGELSDAEPVSLSGVSAYGAPVQGGFLDFFKKKKKPAPTPVVDPSHEAMKAGQNRGAALLEDVGIDNAMNVIGEAFQNDVGTIAKNNIEALADDTVDGKQVKRPKNYEERLLALQVAGRGNEVSTRMETGLRSKILEGFIGNMMQSMLNQYDPNKEGGYSDDDYAGLGGQITDMLGGELNKNEDLKGYIHGMTGLYRGVKGGGPDNGGEFQATEDDVRNTVLKNIFLRNVNPALTMYMPDKVKAESDGPVARAMTDEEIKKHDFLKGISRTLIRSVNAGGNGGFTGNKGGLSDAENATAGKYGQLLNTIKDNPYTPHPREFKRKTNNWFDSAETPDSIDPASLTPQQRAKIAHGKLTAMSKDPSASQEQRQFWIKQFTDAKSDYDNANNPTQKKKSR